MKYILLVLLGQLITWSVFAQNGAVTGKVVDTIDGSPLLGAHVILTSDAPVISLSNMVDDDGMFRFENVENGTYKISVSFVGFQDFSKSIKINDKEFDLGIIKLNEGIELKEIQITEQIVPVIQKGDTTEFNAEAYKTLPDASAEDLIEKMPTVVIEEGKVQAQGEDVKKVLVDGQPFFGNDPNAALKNLPAEVIDKIQIFDQQSEQAQFTGFDDGETSKTINIITKTNMRNGQFGKIYAGYGYEDKYQAGGNINIFNGDQRISLIGMSNNINQQNFSTEDILGVVGSTGRSRAGGNRGGGGGRSGGRKGGNSSGASVNDFLVPQQGGITTANAFGINFSDKWGEKTEVSASCFFNKSDNMTEQLVRQQYFDTEGIDEIYSEESIFESTNINHRFSGQLKYNINDNNSLVWQPKLTWQGNDGAETLFGQTLLNNTLLSQTDIDFNADLSALNLENSLLWKHKFNKDRRTFSANIIAGYAPQKGDSYLLSENYFFSNQPDSTILNQNSILDLNSWNMAANFQYTEPIGENSMLMTNYRASYQQELSDKSTSDFDDSSQEYDVFNSSLSNIFSNDYYTQQLGGGYNYRKGSLMVNAGANAQWAQLFNEQTFPVENNSEHTFLNILPAVRVRYMIDRTENFSLAYRTNTQLPAIEQLQSVVDNNNPLQLTIGNSDLVQSYQHNLFARYSKTNTEKSSVFYALLKGGYTNNYIGSSTYLAAGDNDFPILDENNVTEGVQLTQPINLEGYWNLRSFITYGFPVQPIKSNLNIDFTADYIKTPGLINEELNFSENTTIGIGLTLGSNISDKLDFTLSSRSKYNFAANTLQTQSNTDYINQNTRLKFNWILGDGIVFRTDLIHQFYQGLSDDFDQNYLLWNMSLGKKLFKNQRGEISLSVFDLLKQNNSLSRLATEIYTEDIQANVLQQYFMLSFKYDLRHFKIG